jgi:branched-chain amino acid transport system ATP-binding protein
MAAVLEVDNLHVFYGNIHALRGLSLHIEHDEIVTLIGANGAGKTTTLNAVSSILAPADGEVRFEGEALTYVAPHDVVGRGIVHVPEGRRIFARLTVAENLRMGAFLRKNRAEVSDTEAHVLAMFPVLKERFKQIAGTLSGGEQQMLAMGRGLMSKPRVLLLDEPSMGLAPMLVETIFEAVLAIRKEGVPVLLVEQNAFMALQIADRGYVIETGEIVLEGSGEELLANDDVKRAYLG